jgi:hypothetical protein
MIDEIIQLSGMEKGRGAMNLVSRIVKFLTPDMTGLDCTAIDAGCVLRHLPGTCISDAIFRSTKGAGDLRKVMER